MPEDHCTPAVTERTIQASNKLPSPIRPRSRPDNSPSPTFSEVSLSRYMLTDDTTDGQEMLEIEAAVRPPTPGRSIYALDSKGCAVPRMDVAWVHA